MAGVMLRKVKDYGENITPFQERHNDLLYHENHIRKELATIQESFLYIEYHLADIEYKKLYEVVYYQSSGNYCKNVFEYAFQELDIARTTVYNLMAVAREFSENCTGLKPEYKEYSFSQLVELLSFTEEQRKYANPHLTIKELRTLKKGDSVSWTNENGVLNDCQIPAELLNRPDVGTETATLVTSDTKADICPDVGTALLLVASDSVAEQSQVLQTKTKTVSCSFTDYSEFIEWLKKNVKKIRYPVMVSYEE